MLSCNSLNDTLIKAIQQKSLRETLESLSTTSTTLLPEEKKVLDKAVAATRELDGDVETEIIRLVSGLQRINITPVYSGKATPKALIHNIKLEVRLSQLNIVASFLESEGYSCDLRMQSTFWNRYKKFYGSAIFFSDTRSPFRVQLIWRAVYNVPNRLGQLLLPNRQDLRAINLPTLLWPAYSLVHLFRAVTKKDSLTNHHTNLGPFLGTPDGIIQLLLEFAGLTADDTLIDLGCGDGRVLLAAANLFRCKAIGYETDPTLVKQAKKLVAKMGLSEHVMISQENAEDANLTNASVVFIFLPVQSIKQFVPVLLRKMKAGSVLIAHEQDRLDTSVNTDEQYPVIHPSGVTVAHKWIAKPKS
jgi:precorrin-6B methylase 2